MRLIRAAARTASRQTEDVVLFFVAGQRFAIAAAAVDEICGVESMRPLSKARFGPRALARVSHVCRQAKQRAEERYVVDAGIAFSLAGSHGNRLLLLRSQKAALLVDSVDRMTQLAAIIALPRAFSGEERQWYRGLAILDGNVVPVLESDAILSAGETAVLDAMNRGAESAALQTAAGR